MLERVNKDFDLKSLNIAAIPTIEMCDRAIEVCVASLTAVKQQLIEAKARAAGYGKYSDPNWFARLNGAKGVYGAIHQKLLARRSELVRAQRSASHVAHQEQQAARFRDAFREVVRRNVDATTYSRWLAEADMQVKSGEGYQAT